MFCADTPIPSYLLFTDAVPQLLYYSHIPAAIISLFLGLFVYFKNRELLLSKILLALSTSFFLWVLSNLIVWTNPESGMVMFFWSIMIILSALLFFLSFYFLYVFINKNDISFKKKLVSLVFTIPILILMPTRLNLFDFDASANCGPSEGILWNYLYIIEIAIFILVVVFSIVKYRKEKGDFKKQIIYASVGVGFFLGFFLLMGYLSSLLYKLGLDFQFELEQYGLFGMTFFMGMLAFLIVKFQAFNIKMLKAQALMVTLAVLIGALFFYVSEVGGKILILINLALAIGFGYILVKSVKKEVEQREALEVANAEISERKEELQMMSGRLAEANDQLRKLDNSKSEFISIASHQLRTPLTAIKGFISLLLEGSYGKVEPKQQDVLNKVYTSNERLVNLVEDLLNISRMESGRMEFRFAPWQVADICQEVMDTFMLRAKDSNLYLHYTRPETPLPEVMIDGTKVREVVSNLVDNALKYTPKGGVTVRAERGEFSIFNFQFSNNAKISNNQTTLMNDTGGVIRVTVSDTGIGIPQTELPYLFAKFSRGKDISRLNTGGTGLGLYVGRSMIENNGGKIWAESDGQGLGSRFIIEIPVTQSEELLERWG